MNYKSLTNPFNTAIERTLLGQKVFIRRLSSDELDIYGDSVAAAQAEGQNSRAISILGVQLFIDALVNEDGSRPKKSELPSAVDLLVVHANADLVEAVTTVQRHSYGTLEEATKN